MIFFLMPGVLYAQNGFAKPEEVATKPLNIDSPVYVVDGQIMKSEDWKKVNRQDMSIRKGRGDTMLITTRKYEKKLFEKRLAMFSPDYKEALSKTIDGDFNYVVDGKVLDVPGDFINTGLLYRLKSDDIENLIVVPATGNAVAKVIITTKKRNETK